MSHEELLAEGQRAQAATQSSEIAVGTGDAGSGAEVAGGDTSATVTPDGSTAGGTATGAAGGAAGSGPGAAAAGGAGAGGDAAARSCTGKEAPIVIGTVGTHSGAIGSIAGLGPKGVQVWVAHINAQGGLNCHQVKYVVYDDGGDPSRQQALMQQLIERDKAIAVVQHAAVLTGTATINYLKSKGIAVIGSEGGSQWFYEHPTYFPQAASADKLYLAMTKGYGELARQIGKKRIGVLSCLEVAQCTRSGEIISANAAAEGMEAVYRASGSLVQPDFTSQCQAAKSAGVEIFAVVLDNNGIKRVARNCNSVGFKPQYVSISILANNELGQEPLLDGIMVPQPFRPWTQTDHPAVKEFTDAVARYAPGLQLGGGVEAGWVSAKVFEAAMQDASENPTPAEVLEGLYSLRNNDLGGLTSPLTFTEGQNAPQTGCYWLVQLRGEKFENFGSKDAKCF